ncbi:DEAD-box ATP-dependent RNA helicase 10-like isoform X2 [Trifolium pratense]|uniref:DEAD-box ATP-dependent RNA helicase 10-like isoform X2 n=1 Tax=Trifolium pratense TaxID=57577 RepID=UPI001E6905F7|nr:DEAD-box ATP-dependent RNA helicase 10-like isoform X2 [Trifolium pratense]
MKECFPAMIKVTNLESRSLSNCSSVLCLLVLLEGMKSFTDLGLSFQLVEACEKQLVWYNPMKIQTEVIPLALQGKDVFAISPPRSGKVGAFVLPILHALLETGPNLNTFFACVLSPTRPLVAQIAKYFRDLGSQFGVKGAVLVETPDMEYQSNQISQQPHIIVGTPEQVLNNLRHTQGFSLALGRLKYLVIDDAHLLLNNPSEQQLYDILEMIPSERRTFLFSSTSTEKVHPIQSVCLRNPVKIDLSSTYSILDTLQQKRCSLLGNHKDCYLAYTLAEMTGFTERKSIVFTETCGSTLILALILKNLGFRPIPIIIYMSQAKKLESLNAFKSGESNILLCSDVVSKGLDIPAIYMVINYGLPRDPNDYMYRVGTAHADVAISFVSKYEGGQFNMIERLIGNQLPMYPAPNEDVLLLERRVSEAKEFAQKETKEFGWKSGGYLTQEDVNKIQGFGQRFKWEYYRPIWNNFN